jgi:hypothetical protein
MFASIINWFKDLINPKYVPPKPITIPVKTAANMSNSYEFHGVTYKHPLTVNAQVFGGTMAQRAFFRSALNVMRHVVISEEFQNRVLDRTFTYTDENALEVYKKFLSGDDLYEDEDDAELDIDLYLYFKRNRTIGYTYKSTRKQWINMRHLDIEKYEEMAKAIGNIVHEYMHNCGYGHPRNYTKTRKDSVPYAYGYIARDVALEFLGSGVDIKHASEAVNVRID